MTRYPPGLIVAPWRSCRHDATVVRSGSRATAHMWIEDPMAQRPDGTGQPVAKLNRLFNTHPPSSSASPPSSEL